MIKHSRHSKNRLRALAGIVPVVLTGIFPAQADTVAEDIAQLDALLARAEPDQDCVRIDDMRIKASDLRAHRDRLAASIGTRAAVEN